MTTYRDRLAPRRITNVDIKIGKQLRAYRKQRKVSQGDLAEIVGVTYQQIQKYENGTDRVSAGRLHAIAQYLGVPLAAFFDLDEVVGLESDPGHLDAVAQASADLARMSPRIRACALQSLRVFAEITSKEA